MPVYAELITQASDQDQIDLKKLYFEDADSILQGAQNGDWLLIGGRFNGRLLSALTLTPRSEHIYDLDRLVVRDITRRRGVARQLLTQLLKQPPTQLESIDVNLQGQERLQPLFQATGFKALDSHSVTWRWHKTSA